MSERESQSGREQRLRLTPGLVLWGLLAGTVLLLLAQNSADTSLQFFWLDITAPLFVVIGASLLIGWGLGELGTRLWSWRRRGRDDR